MGAIKVRKWEPRIISKKDTRIDPNLVSPGAWVKLNDAYLQMLFRQTKVNPLPDEMKEEFGEGPYEVIDVKSGNYRLRNKRGRKLELPSGVMWFHNSFFI